MFLNKIKDKIRNIIRDATDIDEYISNYNNYNDSDIDAKTARYNYKLYQDDLRQRQKDIIEKWCQEIRKVSRNGGKHIYTNKFIVADDKDKILYLVDDAGCCCDFPSNSSIGYFQQYFEEKGFIVVKEEFSDDMYFLSISWIE